MTNFQPLNTLIYGSCVSRDLARVDNERFSAGHYTARQSWISAYAEPRPAPETLKLSSAFQQRMIEGDFRSTGGRVLTSTRPDTYDVILLDLIDERLGVLPYEGSWITLSNELKKSKAIPNSILDEFVPFGSDQHFDMWSVTAQQVRRDLDPYMEKTFVIAANFAAATFEGSKLEPFRGEPAEVWNERFARYYETLWGLGFTMIEHPQELVLASETHLWGATPFHYVDEAYMAFGDKILSPRNDMDHGGRRAKQHL